MSQQQIFVTGLTVVDTTRREKLGAIRWVNNKAYKYVKYNSGTGPVAAAAAAVAVYHGDNGWDDSEVSCDYTDGVVVAGVLIGAPANAGFGWMQIKGECTALAVAIEASNDATPVTCADGDPVVRGDADKALRRNNTVVDADAEVLPIVGIAIDASAKLVLLDCPF